jgi:hypothetical protein
MHHIPQSSPVTWARGEPQACYRNWRSALAAGTDALLAVDFELEQYWLADSEPVSLTALYCVSAGGLQVAVTDRVLAVGEYQALEQFDLWVEQNQLVRATPGAPLALAPAYIAKPWGREIWYTGVERRGVCAFATSGGRTPIPWLQAVLPENAAGAAGEPLVLLKILDPVPQSVTGDLYFELHETKREVYVVTHVDESAWPDGTGYIRYGFDPEQVAAAGSEQDFRGKYLVAVEAYEQVRRMLDALPAGVSASSQQRGLERQLRQAMNSFTHMRPLRSGDVVVVPPLLPHALQRGVRVIEFQTPVYERKILSFAQQVLTQDHWDTREALAQARLCSPPEAPFACLRQESGVRVERIVDFPDFEVRRIRLEGGASLDLEPVEDYALAMVIEGELALAVGTYRAEQALLLPRGYQGEIAAAHPAQPLVLLLATPRR